MTLKEFVAEIAEHPDLELVGANSRDEIVVRHGPTGAQVAVAAAGLAETDWSQLEQVCTGKRPGRILTHITRIVGYYSLLHAWNRSKIAELADRHRGQYTLPEPLKAVAA